MKEQFIKLLQATNRKGIDNVVDYLEKVGFFSAPASVNRHLSYDSGLVEHSLNVLKTAESISKVMVEMKPDLAEKLPHDSIVIAALLHDVCKANIYKKIQKWRKDADGLTLSGLTADEPVRVYNLQGMLLGTYAPQHGRLHLSLPQGGVYLIKTSHAQTKIKL